MAYTSIDDPELYFQTVLYTGNATARDITLPGTNDMQPDIVWIKERSAAEGHKLFDSVRGATNLIQPSAVNLEQDQDTSLTSFNSDGFSLGIDSGEIVNDDGVGMVGWCWKMGTTSGISGTGNLTVNGYSFNSTAKQSVIVYTGNGGSSGTYTHGLGSVPGFIFGKNRDEAGDGWFAYHHKNTSAPETDYLVFNTNAATADSDGYWNDTAPTSTLVTVGSAGEVNRAEQQVAYCFAEVQGYSKFGSYTGNNNADGVFVHLGFRPAMVIIRATDTSNWYMWDNKRSPFNEMNKSLAANTTAVEETSREIDFLSNGFKCREARGSHNDAGDFVFYAVAEAPFVNSKGVPNNAR